MAWTHTPGRRQDIIVELYEVLDGSGNYTGDWIETSDINTIRVACSFNGGTPTVRVDEGQYDPSASGDPRLIRSQSIAFASLRAFGEVDLTARYFRLVVSSGSADNPFASTIRAV